MKYTDFIDSLVSDHPLKMYAYNEHNKVCVAFYNELECAFTQLSGDYNNREWFYEKINSLQDDITIENVSSILGEFRAYSIIKSSYFGNNLICNKSDGADFTTKTMTNNINILIEVNTPLGRSDEARTTLSHQTKTKENVTTQIIETAPFGFPQRKFDNFQCEAISKIASIKQDEKQFNEDTINILFIDFVNPFFNDHVDILKDQQKPYVIFQNQITWGALWHAFYAKKDDKIFDHMNNYHHRLSYSMEYDGKFNNVSKINFAFINMIDCLVVYEGFRDVIDINIYPMIFSLNKLKFEDIWINWPVENLKKHIEHTRIIGTKLMEHTCLTNNY